MSVDIVLFQQINDSIHLDNDIKIACESAVKTLSQIHGSTYASILLYQADEIIAAFSNNYNEWHYKFFQTNDYKESGLLILLGQFFKNQDQSQKILLWDDYIKKEQTELTQARQNNDLYHGISRVCFTKQFNICISLCGLKDVQVNNFHEDFKSTSLKIVQEYFEG